MFRRAVRVSSAELSDNAVIGLYSDLITTILESIAIL
jgi:hypothetical protein